MIKKEIFDMPSPNNLRIIEMKVHKACMPCNPQIESQNRSFRNISVNLNIVSHEKRE
jgi:hypothetical protein